MKLWLSTSCLAAGLAVASCENSDTPKAIVSDTQNLVATHAFDSPAPISAVAFSPKDVASWLGAIAMVTTRGDLYVTDIEGGRPRSTGSGNFTDVIGLSRSQQPGLFLTLTSDGDVKAFIEADDESNFKPIPVSSGDIEMVRFCDGPQGVTQYLYGQSGEGIIRRYTVSVDDNMAVKLSDMRPIGGVSLKGVSDCAHSADGTLFVVSSGSKPMLHVMRDGKLSDYKLDLTSNQNLNLAYIDGAEPSETEGAPSYIAVNSAGGNVAALFDAASLEPVTEISVGPGLSIGGLSAASGVFATSSGFGGSAFNDGIIALPDADENRLVIMSRSYVLTEVKLE